MYKKILIFIVLYVLNFNTYSDNEPNLYWAWLPWSDSDENGMNAITNLIWEIIQFVAVIAVISLILSGFLYLISWWEEEKVKKAKNWIIWSLVWVFLSISAWWIINILNNITFN